MWRKDGKVFIATAITVAALLFAGCGGGGGGGEEGPTAPPSSQNPPPATGITTTSVSGKGVAVVAGTLGSGTTSPTTRSLSLRQTEAGETTAKVLITVDTDKNGIFDIKDASFSTEVQNGGFSLEIPLPETNEPYEAQIKVVAEGYAPYLKPLKIQAGESYTLLTEATKIPVLKEHLDLTKLSASAKMTTYVRLGIQKEGEELTSFAKLISLSDLKAEADQNETLQSGTMADYTFPLSAVPDGVQTLDVTMQAFDSTKKEELALFPGEFKGKGLDEGKVAGEEEVGLVSAAFDLFDMRDQNGDPVTLQNRIADKLSATVDLSSCTMMWRRHLTREQAQLIEGWGDYDPSTPEFEVPIWSNDNSESVWKFVGVGNAYDLNGSNPYFEVCIPDEWGAGYLNCDSPVAFQTPTNICVDLSDQDGMPVAQMQINAFKSTSSASAMTDRNGQASLALPDSNLTGWQFEYRGAMTQWTAVTITAVPLPSTRSGCDYDLNVTDVANPFNVQIRVRAYERDGSLAIAKPIDLESTDRYHNAWSAVSVTDANGTAVFWVKPNVTYELRYGAGKTYANVNGAIDNNETADTGRVATVDLHDIELPPRGSVVFRKESYKTIDTNAYFTVYANDPNRESVSIKEIRLNDRVLKPGSDFRVLNAYSYTNGYLTSVMELNLSQVAHIAPLALQAGHYRLDVIVTDGLMESKLSGEYTVNENRAPVVTGVNLHTGDGYYNLVYDHLSHEVNDSYFYVYAYDPDGDPMVLTARLDGSPINCNPYRNCGPVDIGEGDHNLTILASDGDKNNSYSLDFHVGNLPPVILNAGSTRSLVDINRGENFQLYAYVEDPDSPSLWVKATDGSGNEYNLTRAAGRLFRSTDLAPAPGIYRFTVVAIDDKGTISSPQSVVVEVIAGNQPPIFTKELQNLELAINVSHTFECSAYDPEKTLVYYTWDLDGTPLGNGDRQTLSFEATGTHVLTCTATDEDGQSSESTAHITVFDPSATNRLVIHTYFPDVLVGIHDPANHYTLVQSKRTDTNGTATFDITGSRTTFSVTIDPYMTLDPDSVFDMLLFGLVRQAYENCLYGDVNMTECQSADWCALVTGSTLPSWIIDAAKLDTNQSGSDVDLDGDGTITKTEFYEGAKVKFDTNNDGIITLGETNPQNLGVQTMMYSDVIVGTYEIPFVPSLGMEGGEGKMYGAAASVNLYECDGRGIDFNLTITDIDPVKENIYIIKLGERPFYAGMWEELNGSIVIPRIYLTEQDSAGYYDLVIKIVMKDRNVSMALITDLNASELGRGLTLSYLDDFDPSPALVTFTMGINEGLALQTYYANEWIDAYEYIQGSYDENGSTTLYRYLDDPRLTYLLSGQRYGSANSYGHNNYYGDGMLHPFYDAADYPMLDLMATFTEDGDVITFSGSDWGLIDATIVGYNAAQYDYKNYWTKNFSITVYDVLPEQRIDLTDANLTDLYPADVGQFVQAVDNNHSHEYFYTQALEYKGMTADEFVQQFGDSRAALMGFDFLNVGLRYMTSVYNERMSPSAAEREAQKPIYPFVIPFDVSIFLK